MMAAKMFPVVVVLILVQLISASVVSRTTRDVAVPNEKPADDGSLMHTVKEKFDDAVDKAKDLAKKGAAMVGEAVATAKNKFEKTFLNDESKVAEGNQTLDMSRVEQKVDNTKQKMSSNVHH